MILPLCILSLKVCSVSNIYNDSFFMGLLCNFIHWEGDPCSNVPYCQHRFAPREVSFSFPNLRVGLSCMQHYGGAPLPPYEPVFNWRATRASVFGQRIPELPSALSARLEKLCYIWLIVFTVTCFYWDFWRIMWQNNFTSSSVIR